MLCLSSLLFASLMLLANVNARNLYNDCEWIKETSQVRSRVGLLKNSTPIVLQSVNGASIFAKIKDIFPEIEEISGHKYLILESCLYYYLTDKARRSTKRHGSLKTSRPALFGGKILIEIEEIMLRRVHMIDTMQTAAVFGVASVSWEDKRLTWDTTEWKTDQIRIQHAHDIWVPSFADTQGSGNGMGYEQMRQIQVNHRGVVSAMAELTVSNVACEADYTHFPNDKHLCCFEMNDNHLADSVEYKLLDPGVRFSPQFDQNRWKLLETSAVVRKDPGENAKSLRICLRIQRNSRSLQIELVVPMALTAFVVLISPLFGKLNIQLIVKLFALLLQFLCLQFLIERSEQVGVGTRETPKIYRFYEISALTTVSSILVTLIFLALSRKKVFVGPNHRLGVATKALRTKVVCCCAEQGVKCEKDASLWPEICEAFNSVFAISMTLVYCFCVFSIYFL